MMRDIIGDIVGVGIRLLCIHKNKLFSYGSAKYIMGDETNSIPNG